MITFGGSTYAADSSSDFVIAGQTLTPSGALTISGTPISYPTGGHAILIGTSTEALIPDPSPPTITFAGSTYTANSASDFVIDGHTLSPGNIITVAGTPISYAAAGTDVVIGTSTEAVGLGGIIMGGFGTSPSNTSVVEFTGDAVAWRGLPGWALGVVFGVSSLWALA